MNIDFPSWIRRKLKPQVEATGGRYRRLTEPYQRPEWPYLKSAANLLKKDRIPWCLVPDKWGQVELWRRGMWGKEWNRKERCSLRYLSPEEVQKLTKNHEHHQTDPGTPGPDTQHEHETAAPAESGDGNPGAQHAPEIPAGVGAQGTGTGEDKVA